MPTVPRIQGKQVFSEPISAAKQTVSADETTFGGGAPNKSVVAATEQLNNTMQKNIEAQNKLNQRMKTNEVFGLASKELLDAHFSPEPKDFEEKDPITGEIIKVNMPSGIFNAKGSQASVGGGQQKRSFEATNSVMNKYLPMLSPEEQAIFITRMSSTATSLNDRAGTMEASNRKSYIEEQNKANVSLIASNPALTLDEKESQIREQTHTTAMLSGDSKEVAEVAASKAITDAYDNEIKSMLASNYIDEKAIDKTLAKAEKALSGADYAGLKIKVDARKEVAKKNGEAFAIKTQEENMTFKIGEDNVPVGLQVAPAPPFVTVKMQGKQKAEKLKISTGDSAKEYNKVVTSLNKKPAEFMAASTDPDTLADLTMKMVDPNYADEKKRMDHITAADELKLSTSDYNSLGELYNLPPQEKEALNLGFKGIDSYITNDLRGTASEKNELLQKFIVNTKNMSGEKTGKELDKVYNKTLYDFNVKHGRISPNTPIDQAPQHSMGIKNQKVFFAPTGVKPSGTVKPDATSSPKEPTPPPYDPATQKLLRNKTTGAYKVVDR